jgi:hypothetical protein
MTRYRSTWDLSTIPDAALNAEFGRRIPAPPPRAKVLRPCKFCGRKYGARDLRAHLPRCPSRHAVLRKAGKP